MASTSPQLPLEIWFQILSQTLNILLPVSTTPRTYSYNIMPLLLTSHTFHEHCHPVTYPHLRKHKLLQLFTRWKAAHSREVHFYHHPLRTHVRYALPDRVGNPPGEEYETLYSFIKRAYLFGCESVCGTVIPVEGGLDGTAVVPAPPAGVPGDQNNNANNQHEGAPVSATGTGATPGGNVVIAPPPAPATVPAVTHAGGDGGGQGWKGHALQWHVANPTFAAEGTIEMYKDVVEEYRRMICGSRAAEERTRELERTMDMIKNPHRYIDAIEAAEESSQERAESNKTPEMEMNDSMSQDGDEEEYEDEDDDDEEDEFEEAEEDENEMLDDQDELLNEIEAKGGLRRRDSGHGQSSSEMDIDDDDDEEEDLVSRKVDEDMLEDVLQVPFGEQARPSKREPESMSMDYQLEGTSRYRRGLRSRKMERSLSSEQEQLIMDMALDKPYHAMGSLLPFHPLDSVPSTSSSSAPSSSSSVRSDSPAPKPSRTERMEGEMVHKTKSRALREQRLARANQVSSTESLSPSQAPTSSSSSTPDLITSEKTLPASTDSTTTPISTKGDELGFDLASACANTFASDLAFVLARVPGLGAHFHRFEQLAKLKLHVGWAKHAQSRGGNDVFVMSCSRLIGLLAPLANTPLVSERGG
ncbi:hypothetical protein BGZ93_007756 [Podila epicladia]|nr:hypothetical protein BGZ92_001111 [Podila epicladia]KAG0093702.1 hypothetical protein BGZ93_007756 [Podila epicladia]